MDDKFDYIPPTYRSIQEAHEEAAVRSKELVENNENSALSIDDLVMFAGAMSEHLIDEERSAVSELLGRALVSVDQLVSRHPESESLIMGAAAGLILGGLRSTEDLIFRLCSGEMIKARPFLRANRQKAAAKERAQEIAVQFWQRDAEKSIRIGEMADKVWRALADEDLRDQMPETTERIKEWIKSVAPDYARKPGRRRKSP